MGLKYKTAPLSPRIGAEWPKIIENIIFHVFHPKYTKICPKIYRILIWPFWRYFWPKTPILTTFATEFFLATWKFGIYVKKHGRNRRQMVVLGGCVGDLLGSPSTMHGISKWDQKDQIRIITRGVVGTARPSAMCSCWIWNKILHSCTKSLA